MLEKNRNLVKTGLILGLAALLLMLPLGAAFAAAPAPIAGQPNQDCAAAGVTPGFSAGALGSAFNVLGIAGTVYAGQQPQNSINPLSVSQYDVACYQLSIH